MQAASRDGLLCAEDSKIISPFPHPRHRVPTTAAYNQICFLAWPLSHFCLTENILLLEILKSHLTLAGVAQLTELRPMHQEVTGLIPDQGTCPSYRLDPSEGRAGGSQSMVLSYRCLSLSFSLKPIKTFFFRKAKHFFQDDTF